ncbi:hypothetical protein, partial [Bacillus licheniformis]|uniref:hypothetical protein n=1 Tax=Bacillus licheniformis TaxID=1402 RepID=UPI00115DC6B4
MKGKKWLPLCLAGILMLSGCGEMKSSEKQDGGETKVTSSVKTAYSMNQAAEYVQGKVKNVSKPKYEPKNI